MKGKHGFLGEGTYKSATSMNYISSSKHFPKVAIYQSDCILDKQKYPDFSEITVYHLESNANTNLCGSDVLVRVEA